ncbi:MAG: helix-turn-helix transcriptional regulator [Pirellulaceae bacterium]|nr:helix-turn-helix transcriptional regulator [Pirellulaceae bacterium]
MRYSFRLAEVVGHMPDPRKRPGTIKAICEYTGLDRHQVASLLKNEVKYIPLDAMSKLCEYLIDRGFATAEELPGRLFGVEPEHFWEILARRKRLVLCLGVRRGDPSDTLDDAWVVASDSVLLGELLSGVTTLGGTVLHRKSGKPTKGEAASPKAADSSGAFDPHPEHLHQSLVWSPGQVDIDECRAMARAAYEGFAGTAGDKALVCLGSNKSNPVVELLLANAFGCEPFESQDSVPLPDKRSCPIFLRYRDRDPQPPSCCGGLRISRGHNTTRPGIYYATAGGDWEVCPCDERRHDAAFVFYIHRESQGHMEMAVGGFSGRATRLLARLLARRGEEFWPPVYEGQGIQIGAFVVQFTFPGEPAADRDLLNTDLAAEGKIIRLDASVIAERMAQMPESD